MFSQIVTEILELLGEAQKVAPREDDNEGPVHVSSENLPENRKDAIAKMRASYRKRFEDDPPGATKAQTERLTLPRMRFANSYANLSGPPDDGRLELIKAAYSQILLAYGEVVDEIEIRKRLATRLDELAPARGRGAALVPGATVDDTQELERLRDAAAQALDTAATREELAAVEVPLAAVSKERGVVETLVEERRSRAEQIGREEAAIVTPPEAPLGTLVAERLAITSKLTTDPLTKDILDSAEIALTMLRSAWDVAEKEAVALRQMRALFQKQATALRERFGGLVLAKNKESTKQEILKKLAESEQVLAVEATRDDTESFPTILSNASSLIDGLVQSIISTNSAAQNYVKEKLNVLVKEAKQLPTFTPELLGFKETADSQIFTASQKLGAGTGNKASQAQVSINNLEITIAAWRKKAGPAGILLDERKKKVAQKIEKPNPPQTSDAFALELQAIRNKVKSSLAKDLSEEEVLKAESLAAPFDALWDKANEDAKAAVRVTASRLTLSTDLEGIIAAARPAAKIELEKARDLVDRLASLTDVNRDMPRTATLHEALVVRMKEVQAEGSFATTDKEPFTGIDPGVRELAFELCGPRLIGGLDKKSKEALSGVLVSDGPAIKLLAETAFGGNPHVFAKVLGDCGANGLVTLARAMDGDGGTAARKALDGLIAKGGLGDNPAILVQLLGEGPKIGDNQEAQEAKEKRQKQNGTWLKSLAESFSDEAGQAAMATLLGDCGLGTSPGALASLLHENGFEGDGAKVREFADAFVGGSSEQQANRAGFARIVKTGGIAQHPKVLGPLAKQAGAKGVKQIGAAFVEPSDCANLKGLLDRGGMSGDTGTLATKHEHPDTLSKVFLDGLAGDGENLKTFAQAFSGVDGQAKAKEMLDAFNEFEEIHAEARQPGQGIARLLDDKNLKGTTKQKITKLSTQFVPNIRAIPAGTKRNQAIRFAPHFGTKTAQEGWKPKSAAMANAGINTVTASVLKRHQPEAFDRTKMKDDVPNQSMFPPGTDVGAVLDEALGKITPDRTRAQKVPVTVGPPPTVIEVEIGFLNGDMVNHFGPRGSVVPPHPQETPKFSNAEINAIYAASK